MENHRIQVTVSTEIKEWYQNQAKSFGTSMSAMMAIALANYKQQSEGLTALKNVGELQKIVEGLQEKIKDVQK